MPPVIVAALVEAGVDAIVAEVIAQVATLIVGSLVSSLLMKPQAAPSAQASSSNAAGRQQMVRSSTANRMVIYGEVRMSGPIVYASTTPPGDNTYLNLVIALAGHECDSIGSVFFNDVEITPAQIGPNGAVLNGTYEGRAVIRKYLGSPGQQADPYLPGQFLDANWTPNHRGDGICYLAIMLYWDKNVYATGIPNISAIVRGKKCFDPRDGGTRWTQNWALCIRDYLTDTDYGLSCDPSTEISDPDFIAAANVADERASGPAYANVFTANLVFTADVANNAIDFGEVQTFVTGTAVQFSTTGTLPSPLALATTYYLISVSATAARVATSQANALSGVTITLTGAGSGVQSLLINSLIYFATAEAMLLTGSGVQLTTTGTLPSPLLPSTTYYFINLNQTTGQLATSVANAAAGIAIALTDAGSGVHSVNFFDQVRYTINGTVDTGTRPLDALGQLLAAGMGLAVYTSGMWKLFAGAYRSPVGQLTARDLAGKLTLLPRVGRQDLFNGVQGTYVSPFNSWQPVNFPAVTSATYQAQDGGAQILTTVDFPYTVDGICAQRLAKLMLEKSRLSQSVSFPAKFTAFKFENFDNLQVTIGVLGWAAKEFTVQDWQFATDSGVALMLQEEASEAYSFLPTDGQALLAAPPTTFPNPLVVGVPGAPVVVESLYQTTGSAGVKSQANVSWAPAADPFIDYYQLEYKAALDTVWQIAPMANVGATATVIFDLAPGNYDFRAHAFNTMGVSSAYSPVTAQELFGLTAPPSSPTGFSIVASAGFAKGTWNLSPDLDVRIGGRAIVRFATKTSGANLQDGYIMEEFNGDAVAGQMPLVTGTYMLTFEDSTGHESAGFAAYVATEGMVTGYSIVGNVTEDSAFAGLKSNIANTGGAIQLDSATTIDAMATLVDTWPLIDSLGGVSGAGTYTFAAHYDGVTVAPRRFELDLTVLSFDTGDLIDARGNVDDWDSIDGTVISDCDATAFASVTNDDPAGGSPNWGPYTPFVVADFNCRGARFQLGLASGNQTHNISCSLLRVDIKA